MFYKTTRKIRPGEELFVYYGDDYARFLGIQPFNSDSIGKIWSSSKAFLIFYLDDNNKSNEDS